MKNKVYYHIYMPDDESWTYIFVDQMSRVIDSGLIDHIDTFHVICIGNKLSIETMNRLLTYYHSQFKINFKLTYFNKGITDKDLLMLDGLPNRSVLSETQTLSIIRNESLECEDDYNIMYFHAKGVTSIERLLKTGLFHKFVNTVHWRKHLEWGVIDKYKECIDLLKTNDTVGTNLCPWPCNHYSGNYWWATSSYIKSLPDPNDSSWWDSYKNIHADLKRLPDRLVAEMWIGSGNDPKHYNFFTDPTPPPVSSMGDRLVLMKEYYK